MRKGLVYAQRTVGLIAPHALVHATVDGSSGLRGGRAQPLTSRVLTHLGWRQIGKLKPGDYVIGSNGRSTQVLGVYPQGEKQVFRITATDGASTRCCAEHLWAVFTPEDRSRSKSPRIVDVREMMGQLRCAHRHRFEKVVRV